MTIIELLVNYVAPIFLVTSPLTSYADQIWSIHSKRTSLGFSLDIPLIMLLASILRIFYWFGVKFETSLLIQSVIMVCVQILLLKVALDHKPIRSEESKVPFATTGGNSAGVADIFALERPYQFWQWRQQRPFWEFLGYFTATVGVLQLLFGQSPLFISIVGFTALGIEATLPIPQVLANHRNRSCKGFRLSVIIFWLMGDCMKGVFFTYSETPLVFKLCGLCQFCFDLTLAWQYWYYGDGSGIADVELAQGKHLM